MVQAAAVEFLTQKRRPKLRKRAHLLGTHVWKLGPLGDFGQGSEPPGHLVCPVFAARGETMNIVGCFSVMDEAPCSQLKPNASSVKSLVCSAIFC